ncbi:3914_t:CDS:2, partial [Funneliformis geosporum]
NSGYCFSTVFAIVGAGLFTMGIGGTTSTLVFNFSWQFHRELRFGRDIHGGELGSNDAEIS